MILSLESIDFVEVLLTGYPTEAGDEEKYSNLMVGCVGLVMVPTYKQQRIKE